MALAATLQAPEDADADGLLQDDVVDSEEDANTGAEAATVTGRYRDAADSSSEAGSCSSSARSRLSLASVVSAADHQTAG